MPRGEADLVLVGAGRTEIHTGQVEEGSGREARETQGQVWVITASGVSTHTVSTLPDAAGRRGCCPGQ